MSAVVQELYVTIQSRKLNLPAGSYTARLFAAGPVEIAKKVGEEAIEVILAAQRESSERVAYESADLIYHLLVLLASREVEWDAVEKELERRRGATPADTT